MRDMLAYMLPVILIFLSADLWLQTKNIALLTERMDIMQRHQTIVEQENAETAMHLDLHAQSFREVEKILEMLVNRLSDERFLRERARAKKWL